MIIKEITYTDLNGKNQVEEFAFNLSRAELIKFNFSESGLEEKLEAIIATKDNAEIMRLFEDIISSSVGKKSVDGKRFIKNDELKDNFMQSEAYTELLLELMGDTTAKAAATFVNSLVPNLPVQPVTIPAHD